MKQLSLVVVLIAATGLGVAFRHGLSGTSQAARETASPGRLDEAAGADVRAAGVKLLAQRDEAAQSPGLLRCVADIGQAKVNDVLLARIAAECGNHLLEQARRNPENHHLLRQAAQHYRACLSHEVTASDPGTLFQDARASLQQAEALLKQPAQPRPAVAQAPPPTPQAAPSAPTQPRRVVEPQESKPLMVGPDGVPIHRAVPED